MTDIPIFFFIAMGGALGIGLPLGLALRELRSTEAKNQGAYNKASTRALALTKKELLNFGYDKFWTKEEFDSLNLIFKPNL